MEAFNTYCNVLGWIVMCGCSVCIIASTFGLFYLMFEKYVRARNQKIYRGTL